MVAHVRNLYHALQIQLKNWSEKFKSRSAFAQAKQQLRAVGIPLRPLTTEQKKQVNEVWNGRVRDFSTHELVFSATGIFDPYVCSELLARTVIDPVLNPSNLRMGMSDKNYFDRLFPDVPKPETIARNVNGSWLDKNYCPITETEALTLIREHEQVFVKPSLDSGGGKSAALFRRETVEEIVKQYPKNCIVQKVFRQHASVAALNPSSVNVVRVVSLHLNGRATPVNCALRCGATGAVTDNFTTKDGHGMIVIGVNPDGTLKDKAYFSCGESITVAPNGYSFAGLQLPNFEKMLEMTTRIHEQLPHFRYMGFDICFAEDGTPTLMEYNIRRPGVLYYQYVNGPLFGDRTEEIINAFCK